MKKLEEMSLLEKVGQLMMFGFQDNDLDGMLELIEKYKVGNIILFARNCKDAKSIFELNKKLQKHALQKLGHPLFISIDQEGGMVTRILKDATFFPGNMTIAATHKEENAYQIGDMMGKELNSLGINMNLAPVLDVNNNINNPVIGVRSYGDNPNEVAKFGTNFIKGLQNNNVLATGKHFPGHGDTSVDSHLDLTTVNHDKKRLNEVELVPFKKAIEAHIGAIMSAHVLFPAYEEEKLPATLSKKVLTDLLRNELGYDGLIVTDCMEMKAIDTYFTTEIATVKAVGAGANLVCISHTRQRQINAMNEIIKAVEEKQLDEKIIDDAVRRVLISKERVLNDVIAFTNKSFDEVKTNINTLEHKAFAGKVMDEALTLVNGKRFKENGKVLFIASKPTVTTIADDEVDQKGLVHLVKKAFPHWNTIEIKVTPTKEEMDQVIKDVEKFDQIVYCTYNANIYRKQIELLKEVQLRNNNIHVIALRNPYDVINLNLDCVCVYEYSPLSVLSVIKYLEGKIEPTGSIPVKL